jgi:hypothetical protein
MFGRKKSTHILQHLDASSAYQLTRREIATETRHLAALQFERAEVTERDARQKIAALDEAIVLLTNAGF